MVFSADKLTVVTYAVIAFHLQSGSVIDFVIGYPAGFKRLERRSVTLLEFSVSVAVAHFVAAVVRTGQRGRGELYPRLGKTHHLRHVTESTSW